MSAVLRSDNGGVLLNYGDPGAKHRHHAQRQQQVADAERCALVAAEREFRALALLVEHLDVAEYGRSRIYIGLATIQRALNIRRRECGMTAPSVENAA